MNLAAVLALHPEAVDNFLHNPRSASDSNILSAHWTVLLKHQLVLNAPLAKQLVAVVTLLCVFGHLCYS